MTWLLSLGSWLMARRRDGRSTARQKRSITLDADVAEAVDRLVAQGAAASFSAALNEAAWRWAANKDLGLTLDAIYEANPAVRPSEEEVREAADRLGLP